MDDYEAPTHCYRCGNPMTYEPVERAPEPGAGTLLDAHPGYHDRATCPECGDIVEPPGGAISDRRVADPKAS